MPRNTPGIETIEPSSGKSICTAVKTEINYWHLQTNGLWIDWFAELVLNCHELKNHPEFFSLCQWQIQELARGRAQL